MIYPYLLDIQALSALLNDGSISLVLISCVRHNYSTWVMKFRYKL